MNPVPKLTSFFPRMMDSLGKTKQRKPIRTIERAQGRPTTPRAAFWNAVAAENASRITMPAPTMILAGLLSSFSFISLPFHIVMAISPDAVGPPNGLRLSGRRAGCSPRDEPLAHRPAPTAELGG